MAKTIDPPMHTAEHLLNRTMVRMFGCGRCFSAHIEKKKSKCDYHFERPLKAEETSGPGFDIISEQKFTPHALKQSCSLHYVHHPPNKGIDPVPCEK